MNGHGCYVLEAPAVGRRDDPPGRVGRTVALALLPIPSFHHQGSECGIRAS